MSIIEREELDPRVVRTRALLEQALFELMKEKAFQKITVQDITDRATVNRATFYAHFADKYDLMTYTLAAAFRRRLDETLIEPTRLTEANLKQLVHVVYELIQGVGSHCKPTAVSNLLPHMMMQLQTNVYETVLNWMKTLPEGKESLETLAMISSGAIFGSVTIAASQKFKQTPDKLADAIVPLIMAGIGNHLD